MSKKEQKTVALTSLKSLGGAIPEFTMPVKVPRVDGTLADLSFTVKGLRRTEWAAARDAYIETLRSKEEATSLRRLAVAWSSSITAGYLTPLTLLVANVPQPLLLSMAFLVGAGAQRVLVFWLRKYWPDAQEG